MNVSFDLESNNRTCVFCGRSFIAGSYCHNCISEDKK